MRKEKPPKTLEQLLDLVDPSWRCIIPKFFTEKDPNPCLSSLFHNPFRGVWDYKDRRKPTRRSLKTSFHEVYCMDRRRTQKYLFHHRVRILVEKAFDRFGASNRRAFEQRCLRRRKGLFAGCLRVETLLQCFKDAQVLATILEAPLVREYKGTQPRFLFSGSNKMRRYIRSRLVIPQGQERWASCFNVHKKTIMRRISELEQETPSIVAMIEFAKNF